MSESRGVLSTDKVLQTVGGILLAISLGISSWSLLQIIAISTRTSVLETKQDSTDRTATETKSEFGKKLDDISRQLERMNDKLDRKP